MSITVPMKRHRLAGLEDRIAGRRDPALDAVLDADRAIFDVEALGGLLVEGATDGKVGRRPVIGMQPGQEHSLIGHRRVGRQTEQGLAAGVPLKGPAHRIVVPGTDRSGFGREPQALGAVDGTLLRPGPLDRRPAPFRDFADEVFFLLGPFPGRRLVRIKSGDERPVPDQRDEDGGTDRTQLLVRRLPAGSAWVEMGVADADSPAASAFGDQLRAEFGELQTVCMARHFTAGPAAADNEIRAVGVDIAIAATLDLQLPAEHLGGGEHRCRRAGGIAQGVRDLLEKGAPAGCLGLGLSPIGLGLEPVGHVGRLDKDIGDRPGPVADRLVDEIEQALFLRPARLPRKQDGPQEERLLDFVYQPIRNRSGAVTDIFVEATDVTDRLKAEADRAEAEAKAASRRAFLEQVSDALRDAAGPAAAMLAAAEMLGRQLKVERCGYGDVDADGAYFIVGGRWPGGEMPSHADRLQLAEFGPELVAECRSGRAVRIRDTHLDPRAAGWQATYEKLGPIRAAILVPLIRDGAFVAALYAHQSTPREWTEEEEDLIREVAERSWTAVERARAEQSAIDSAERLRLATEAASIGTWDYDPVGGTLEWDARCKALFGLPADAPVTYEGVFLAGLHPDDRAAADLAVRRALDEQSPERFDIEYRTIGIEDGVERWIAATGDAIFEAGKAVRFIGTVIDISARKKAERHLKILNDTGAAVAAELNLERSCRSSPTPASR